MEIGIDLPCEECRLWEIDPVECRNCKECYYYDTELDEEIYDVDLDY